MVRFWSYCGLLVVTGVVHLGCASFNPRSVEEVGLLARAETKSREDLRIRVAIPSREEARELFDSKLHKKKIQPIWLEVENGSSEPILVSAYSVDPDYYPPLEVAWLSHRTWAKKTNKRIDDFYYEHSFPAFVGAGGRESGFMFVNLDKGAKYVPIDVLQKESIRSLEFFVSVPGFRADHTSVDFVGLWEEASQKDFRNEEEVRRWAESLPCCTSNKKGTGSGDPVNFVLVASDRAFKQGFLRAGWDETAAMGTGSTLKTGAAAIFGFRYRNAPISALYFFDRPQDMGLQKARSNINQRNHLRLWLAPVTYRGNPVWLGQISRDIGSKLTTKSSTFTTHKIDPDVDDARDAFVLEMISAHVLSAVGYVQGVGERPPESPGLNLTDDPFITDGLRAVMFLSEETMEYADLRFLEWEEPARDF